MKKDGYYSSGEFARMAHVTLRTIRYYDKHNILKPSLVTDSGARFYTDADFARLQQILLLKYLGFSLDDIRQMTVNDSDYHYMADSLNIQLKLVQDKIEQMQLVEKAIRDTSEAIQTEHHVDWNKMLDLIHLTGMEKSLKNQYQNASNITSRINLHQLYSQNPQDWFSWIYEQCEVNTRADAMKQTPSEDGAMLSSSTSENFTLSILELGCGNGNLWAQNMDCLPENVHITLSDRSGGMLRDTRRSIGSNDPRFSYERFDCAKIPYPENSFDIVIANHLLFYCEDIPKVCREAKRVLKPGGIFICSTYGKNHMKEVSQLAAGFDDRIVLAAEHLYDKFGLENGMEILKKTFDDVTLQMYEDELIVPDAEPLVSYILSCHGNQNQYIIDHYKEFLTFVQKKTQYGFHITKEAGAFICK